jgi:DNA-binding transcriptional ArsR family regulator
MNTDYTLTVAQLAELQGVDYQTASGLLRYLREKGIATEVGVARRDGKGRAATEYRLPKQVVLTFGAPVEEKQAA